MGGSCCMLSEEATDVEGPGTGLGGFVCTTQDDGPCFGHTTLEYVSAYMLLNIVNFLYWSRLEQHDCLVRQVLSAV